VRLREEAEALRSILRQADDARYGAMMKVWAKVSDNPKKAGYLAAAIAVVFFVLGWMVG